ncbi:phosphotransferase [Rhodococcus spelaei]|uniref:Phosphotransferase n=1 Tax=Rhodococcus spelaei TaxID=2546320 RepID=A0A541BNQ9_9NOCA|nr:phosphotransferase [Rhodococcus spelaei]TQF73954.1 phosphotransferase [Rhodococcus spelaei]
MNAAQALARRFAASWREPMYRSGYLLVANSALTSAAGVGFWTLAARLYPPEVVGANSAAVSAMMFLAGIAQLNMMNVLLRFVPIAGTDARRMTTTALIVGAGLSGLAAVVFLAGLRQWSPGLTELLRGPIALSFVVATMGWAVFVIQDSALVAVGRAVAVPAENLGFALVKVALVVWFAQLLPGAGIWAAWAAAMIVAVSITTGYLFARAIPRFAATAHSASRAHSLRVVGRYLGPDYLSSLAWIACTSLIPVLVLNIAGAREAAVFALAWLVGTALYDAPSAFGQSLVAHGVGDQTRLDERFRQVRRHTLALVIPGVVVLVLFTPFVLTFFGPFYAANGTATLRLFALSAIPNVEVALSVSRARAASDMRTVVAAMTTLAAIVIGLTVILVPHIGIAGAGVAWLTAQLVVAAALVVRRRPTRVVPVRLGAMPHTVRLGPAGKSTRTVRRILADVPGKWDVERPIPTVADTAVILVRSHSGRSGVLKMSTTDRGAEDLRREVDILRRLREDNRLGAWRALIPVVLEATHSESGDYLLASRLPGRDARDRACLPSAALDAIEPLHQLDARTTTADATLLVRWVDEPSEVLRRAVRPGKSCAAIDRLVAALHDDLEGRPVRLGWTHGDFHPGNLMLADSGSVSGIIDWGRAHPDDLAVLDTTHWLLTSPVPGRRKEFGRRVADRLAAESCWSPAETLMLHSSQPADPLPARALLLLSWLRHVTDNLSKSQRYTSSPIWMHRNVIPVLRQVGTMNYGTHTPTPDTTALTLSPAHYIRRMT